MHEQQSDARFAPQDIKIETRKAAAGICIRDLACSAGANDASPEMVL